MAAPTFVHGKTGTISVGATLFNALQFSFLEHTTNEDITYTQGPATYKTIIPGYNWVDGTISFIYDTSNQPVLSPFDFVPGAVLLAFILYPDGTKPYSFNAYIGTLGFSSGPQAGAVKCTTNFESSGTVTHPSS